MKKTVRGALAAILCLALLSACGGEGANAPAKQVDLSAFAQSLQEEHEFASWLTDLSQEAEMHELIEAYLPGLLEMDLEQQAIYMSMMRINNGEFCAVQAKSAEDANKVKEIFQGRIDYMVEGGAWYPGPTELWTNCSRVVVNGSYVLLVCAEECDQIVSQFNALFA